jgi:hypothetical protein
LQGSGGRKSEGGIKGNRGRSEVPHLHSLEYFINHQDTIHVDLLIIAGHYAELKINM